MLTGFIVEGRLSPVRLRESWDELLSKWPILAARLRPIKGSKPDKWEYHIPCARKLEELRHVEGGKLPLESRPFLLLEKPGRIRDSYRFETGSELPQDRIIAQPINDDFSLWAANSARSVSALLIEDRPMVSVQITRFEDATMVCISTPHVLCDGYGNREIMRAWTKVLEHRLAGGPELQPLAGLDKDFFKVFAPGGSEAAREVGKPTSAPVGWRAYTSWETALFLFCFLVDLFWTRPRSTIQNWEVFVPANEVKRLKDQAMDELRNRTQEERLQGKEQSAHGDSAESTEEDWVSSSDVLVGWALKVCIVHTSRSFVRTLTQRLTTSSVFPLTAFCGHPASVRSAPRGQKEHIQPAVSFQPSLQASRRTGAAPAPLLAQRCSDSQCVSVSFLSLSL